MHGKRGPVFEWGGVLILAVSMGACAGLARVDPDPWQWEVERGVTYAALADACLDWHERHLALHIAEDVVTHPGDSFLFEDVDALARGFTNGSADCQRLRREWPAAEEDTRGLMRWLDLLAETAGDPRRQPEALYALRETGSDRLRALAEVVLLDATVVGVLSDRPGTDSPSEALARALLYTFGVDLSSPALRLDDSLVLLALAEEAPELGSEILMAPYEMAGWAALAGLLRYLAADLHRLAWCHSERPFGPALSSLVEATQAESRADGSLSRAAAYFGRNREHFQARCLDARLRAD